MLDLTVIEDASNWRLHKALSEGSRILRSLDDDLGRIRQDEMGKWTLAGLHETLKACLESGVPEQAVLQEVFRVYRGESITLINI